MTQEIIELIEILKKSIDKNGKNKPITLGHMLNLLEMAKRNADKSELRKYEIDEYPDCNG